ncbi:FecR domain-containing protein [Pectobacterium aroidearum]|uniref:FecR domain-containing protein n=1 Tax=Pectobacterium aroidearum TaxID=1201031 RepID=UPI0021144E19|nr:FecR domain-containing protein [Pectobacterium aroidearum]UUE44368.1 FecR domain-containing protein [Pectobacterium aroidearum]UUE48586.1 FecR domain-containing protein [Pectobacterium aroidearum]UUE52791.1 FecR domain-containing protein [Pectobacterium aroidearum]UUE61202.1 FecR domain-containing protein [Pectobacterium aroidearum]UUE65424.1 FecR domain-containing protein [Pectobacterium aroidearum]
MNNPSLNKPSFIALQEASQWYAQLCDREPGDEHYHHWQRWMDESEEHRHAWEFVLTVSQRFQPLRGDGQQPALDTLLHKPASMTRRRALKLAALLSTGTLLSWLTYRHTPLKDSLLAMTADHHSAVGEIKSLTLPDNTRLWLNTASAIDIRYSDQRREIALLAGDILIETAADERPFFVTTAQGRMQALGTRFSVAQEPEATTLTVYQHAVDASARYASAARRVNAGYHLRFNADGQGNILPNQQNDADWSHGRLQADNMPLGEVVAQLSRYRHGYLACQPAIADLRVMGTFPLTDTDMALNMLEQAFPVRIHRRFPWWVTVEPR